MSSPNDSLDRVVDTTGIREPQQSVAVAILRAAAEGLLAVDSAEAMVGRLRAHASAAELVPAEIRPNRRV